MNMTFSGEFEIRNFSEADSVTRGLGKFGHSSGNINSLDYWHPLEDSDEGRKELARRIDALLAPHTVGTHGDVRIHALRRFRQGL
jgi:hypothetical protein